MKKAIFTALALCFGAVLAADQFAPQRAEFTKYYRQITGKDAPDGIVKFAIDPKVSKRGRDAYRIVSGNAAVFWVMTALIGRLNPARLFSKSLPAMLTAFTTSSSNATIPDAMRAAEGMGIAPKVYSLAIPLGASVNKTGIGVYLIVVALALAKIYGVAVSAAGLLSLGVSAMILVMAIPGLPGGMILGASILMTQLGVPIDAVGLIIGIDPLVDIFSSVCSCLGTLTATLVVASREGLLDTTRYNSDQLRN